MQAKVQESRLQSWLHPNDRTINCNSFGSSSLLNEFSSPPPPISAHHKNSSISSVDYSVDLLHRSVGNNNDNEVFIIQPKHGVVISKKSLQGNKRYSGETVHALKLEDWRRKPPAVAKEHNCDMLVSTASDMNKNLVESQLGSAHQDHLALLDPVWSQFGRSYPIQLLNHKDNYRVNSVNSGSYIKEVKAMETVDKNLALCEIKTDDYSDSIVTRSLSNNSMSLNGRNVVHHDPDLLLSRNVSLMCNSCLKVYVSTHAHSFSPIEGVLHLVSKDGKNVCPNLWCTLCFANGINGHSVEDCPVEKCSQ